MNGAERGVGGYVLVGGNSSRMGTDKAVLPIDGRVLAQVVAGASELVVGHVAMVGDPVKYARLGYRVLPDLRPHQGPLSGLEAALLDTTSEWNLVLACDLGSIDVEFLTSLCTVAQALPPAFDCLVPRAPDGRPHPLSALYRKRCAAEFSRSLDRGDRKLLDAVGRLRASYIQIADPKVFQNVNTPAEWTQYIHDRLNRLPAG